MGCAALGLLALAPQAAADRATLSAPCQVISFSPAFAADGTAFCAHQSFTRKSQELGSDFRILLGSTGPVQIFTTTDFGKSWRSVRATGLPAGANNRLLPSLTQIAFSAAYSWDRAIFLWAGQDGLFRSTDAGLTWTKSLTLPGGSGRLTPILLTPADKESNRPAVGALLYAAAWSPCPYGPPGSPSSGNALVIWPDSLPVLGPECSRSTQYLVPHNWPDSTVLLLGTSYGKDNSLAAAVWNCQLPAVCATPSPLRTDSNVSEGWFDERTPGVLRAVVRDNKDGAPRLVHSLDAGRSWKPWGKADPLVKATSIVKLTDGGDGRTFILRASDGINSVSELRTFGLDLRGFTPQRDERIYRTTDDGRTWKLVAASPARAGVPGLPFNEHYGYAHDRGGMWQQGTRLFALAETDVSSSDVRDAGVWCSMDGGRRWTPRCPR